MPPVQLLQIWPLNGLTCRRQKLQWFLSFAVEPIRNQRNDISDEGWGDYLKLISVGRWDSNVILILKGLIWGVESAVPLVDGMPWRWILCWIINMPDLLVELHDYGWKTWCLTDKSFGLSLLHRIIAVCDYSVDTWHSATLHWAENSSPGHLKIEGQRCFPLEQLDTSWGFSVGDGWAPPVALQPLFPQSWPNPPSCRCANSAEIALVCLWTYTSHSIFITPENPFISDVTWLKREKLKKLKSVDYK